MEDFALKERHGVERDGKLTVDPLYTETPSSMN